METIYKSKWKRTEDFFNRCFERFGSMNKNDYEVELFHLMLQNEYSNASDHYLSTLLKMPLTKVRRLRYEVDSQYPPKAEQFKHDFYEIVNNKAFKSDNQGNLLVAVNNKALREYLSEQIEAAGSFFDSSFSNNIIRLTPTDFLLLIAGFEKKEEIVKKVKQSIEHHAKELPKDVWEEGALLLKSIFKDVTNPIAPNIADYLLKKIENV